MAQKTKEESDRIELIMMIMSEIGFEKATQRGEDGWSVVSPSSFLEALEYVYEYLGPEGLRELDIQSGVDAFGNRVL